MTPENGARKASPYTHIISLHVILHRPIPLFYPPENSGSMAVIKTNQNVPIHTLTPKYPSPRPCMNR
jgi:hypothetical protein